MPSGSCQSAERYHDARFLQWTNLGYQWDPGGSVEASAGRSDVARGVSPRSDGSPGGLSTGVRAAPTPHRSGMADLADTEEALEKILRCGDPNYGLTLFHCPDCKVHVAVPFSCKQRICPSCSNRRAEDVSDRLLEQLPKVTYRHVVDHVSHQDGPAQAAPAGPVFIAVSQSCCTDCSVAGSRSRSAVIATAARKESGRCPASSWRCRRLGRACANIPTSTVW